MPHQNCEPANKGNWNLTTDFKPRNTRSTRKGERFAAFLDYLAGHPSDYRNRIQIKPRTQGFKAFMDWGFNFSSILGRFEFLGKSFQELERIIERYGVREVAQIFGELGRPFGLSFNIQQLINRGGHREDLFRGILDYGSAFLGTSARLARLEGLAISLDKAILSSEFSLL